MKTPFEHQPNTASFIRKTGNSIYYTITSILLSLVVTGNSVSAQSANLSFENWSNLTTTNYDSVYYNYYGIINPLNGAPDGWNCYYGAYSPQQPITPSINYYGVIKTDPSQSFLGTASIMINTWYYYGRSTITYEDTTSVVPVSISGKYKRITEITANDTLHTGSSKGYAFVLSSMYDTLYRGEITFYDTSVWSSFNMPLLPYSPSGQSADRIFIAFVNDSNFRTCEEQGVCDLLWLDEISINFGTTSLNITGGTDQLPVISPNPAKEDLIVTLPQTLTSADRYIIYDQQGRPCQTGGLHSKVTNLDIRQLSSGIYHLIIRNAERTYTHRFLKE